MSNEKALKIAQALEAKKNALKPVSILPNNIQANNTQIKIVKNVRENSRPSIVQAKIAAIDNANALQRMMQFAKGGGNLYVTFGGVGDLILLLAEAHEDKSAKIIYFANSTSKQFGQEILYEFKINNMVFDNIFGSPLAHQAVDMLRSTNRLQTSAHLPLGLDYGDWIRDNNKYASRLVTNTNWIEKFGTEDKLTDRKFVIIAPSGSYRKMYKQKYLQQTELQSVLNIYLQNNFVVYITGSENDKLFYQTPKNPNLFWLTSNSIQNFKNQVESITTRQFLKILNSATEFCSVDTWLKTYSCLIGKPTKVFDNRYFNKYAFGSDSGDYIFLNTHIWRTMNLCTVENFIANNGFL